MKELKIKVKNDAGFHARPASQLVNLAATYQSSIHIFKSDKEVNLKSILGLLSLGIAKNEEVIIRIEGNDESQALAAIEQLGKEAALW
ncbi:MAG TPA: phosphocarrier protein HPr [Firmicutes bacterium]|jgi:phosphocarrier protein HPr|nr:phosphocarrier protein HPr [Bacillota bacterium]